MAASDLADFIRAKIEDRGLTVVQFAKRSKLSRAAVYKVLNAEIREVRLSTFIKFAYALEVHPLEMMRVFFSRWEFPQDVSSRSQPLIKGDDISFVADITYPDNALVSTGQVFEKVWRIRNVGKSVWQDRRLVCMDSVMNVECNGRIMRYGLKPVTYEVLLPEVKPGESFDVAITFTAPDSACSVLSNWKMCDADYNLLFPELSGLYCLVRVV